MNKKRIGFTLAEVLITLVIMGFIATIGFQVMQIQKTAYTSLAYYAYKDLKSIASEIMLTEMQGKVPANKQMTYFASRKDGKEETGLHERLFKDDSRAPEDEAPSFCQYMADMMNTQGKVDCSTVITDHNYTYYQAMTTRSASQEASSASETRQPLTIGKSNFTTTNGMKYYIGKHQTLDDDYGKHNIKEDVQTGHKTTYGYRIIAVDLNGKSKPNITHQNDGHLPVDIVTFAIVDNGEVLPLGAAANNVTVNNKGYRYLSSKLYGFIYRDVPGYSKNVPLFCTNTGIDSSGNPRASRCNYSKEIIRNNNVLFDENTRSTLFTFRQAYCNTLQFPGEEIILNGYCDGENGTPKLIDNRSTRCPCGDTDGGDPSIKCPVNTTEETKFDICKQEVIKPMFRFNFK